VSGDSAVVCLMRHRRGQSLGAQSFFPTCPLGATEADVLAQFVAQHYLDGPIPADLVVSTELDDEATLAQVLSDRAGHRVTVRHAVRGERARQLALARTNAVAAMHSHLATEKEVQRRRQDLARLLNRPEPPHRIVCFDISHTQGEATVAACVVFGPSGPEKASYRRYNITGITPGDDYAAMHQALTRRFRRLNQGEGEAPDLLLIDGGLHQVEQALAALVETGVAARGIQVVGVAKGPARRPGEETLVQPGCPDLHPGPTSPGLQLIQAVRDEAHRFAITGHRRRRQVARDHSVLETIPGIGPARRQALLRAFGGWQGVMAASADDLTRVPGLDRALASRLHQALHAE
jgi:excinuclease ABC subunit C